MELLKDRRDVTGGWGSDDYLCFQILNKLEFVAGFLRKTKQK